jgi:hypothetical protein
MAARINPMNEKHRETIKTTQLLKRVQMYALNEPDPQSGRPVEMTATQVRAAELLLNKVLPNLQAVEGSMDVTLTKHEEALEQLE